MFSIVGCGIRWAIKTVKELSVEFPKDEATAILTIWLKNSVQACRQLDPTSGDASSYADTLAHGIFPDYAPLPWLELFEDKIAADEYDEEFCDLYIAAEKGWIAEWNSHTDSLELPRTVPLVTRDMPDNIKILCMQTYMRKVPCREGGKVRGYNGTGKDHPDTVRTSKKGTDRKSGSGGHNKSADSLLCKSCGTTKPRGCYLLS
jgi:hypothetical protein